MVWGCPLLGFHSRVRIGSYKGHFKGKAGILLNKNTFHSFHVFFLVIGSHIVLHLYMTLKRKNNNSNEFSVFKLFENEVLHNILWLFCEKLKIQNGHGGNHLDFDL